MMNNKTYLSYQKCNPTSSPPSPVLTHLCPTWLPQNYIIYSFFYIIHVQVFYAFVYTIRITIFFAKYKFQTAVAGITVKATHRAAHSSACFQEELRKIANFLFSCRMLRIDVG